jgi:hypothetical protein
MSNIINIERDMFWGAPGSFVTPVSNALNDFSPDVGVSAAVGERISGAFSGPISMTASAGDTLNMGALILPSLENEYVPYRFKGYASTSERVLWRYGFWDSSTPQADVCYLVGEGNEIDECIAIAGPPSGGTGDGLPLVFFGSILRGSAETVFMNVSVQRMVAKPPQYATASS